MTDWNLENRETLRRIVALLLALAGIAERVSGLSGPVRRRVLWFLRPAEAVARDFIVGDARDTDAPPSAPSTAYGDDGPAAALRLAGSFRALATMLAILVALVPAPARRRPSRRDGIGIGAPAFRARASLSPRYAPPTGVRLGGSSTRGVG